MQNVALHLQTEAVSRSKSADRDAFGRSAYNRYYYATFLTVRAMLSKFDPKWSSIAHATYPELLAGSIRKTLVAERRRARKIKDNEVELVLGQAIGATNNLAELMRRGYAVRITADYEPNIAVDFNSSARFQLNGVDITEAHQWPEKARIWTESISSAWSQIHD